MKVVSHRVEVVDRRHRLIIRVAVSHSARCHRHRLIVEARSQKNSELVFRTLRGEVDKIAIFGLTLLRGT